jgi:hypothetical protein
MKQDKKVMRETLASALAEVAAAEVSLETLLRQLRVGPRAEKVGVTAAVEAAFSRLRVARTELAKLIGLVDAQ